MSSRLYLARLTVWLLLMLGGYGVAHSQATLTGVAVSSQTVCGGSGVTFNPVFTGVPTNGASLTYSVFSTAGPAVGSPVVVTTPFEVNNFIIPAVSTPTTFTVAGRFQDGATTTNASTTILVNPSPGQVPGGAITASFAPSAICAGQSSTATISPTAGLTIASAFGPGFLNPLTPASFSTVSTTTSSSASSGIQTYTLNVANIYGCTAPVTATLNVQSPIVTLVPSATILNCSTAPVTFTAASALGLPASTTYAFGQNPANNAPQSSSANTYSIVYPGPNLSGTVPVNVTVTTALGCTYTTTYSLSYNTVVPTGPSVTFVAPTSNTLNGATLTATNTTTGLSGTVCQNQPLSFSVSGCASASTISTTIGNPAIIISGPAGSTVIGATTISSTLSAGIAVYQISTTGVTGAGAPFVYTVACQDPVNGCSSTAVASLTLTVNPTPAVAPTIASQSICAASGPVVFTPTGCPTSTTAIFRGVGIPASGTVASSLTVVTSGFTSTTVLSYTVACINSSSCVGPQTPFSLTVFANPANGPFVSVSPQAPGSATTIDARLTSTGGSVTVCQNSTLTLSVTGCASTTVTSTTNIIVGGGGGGAIGGGGVVTPAPGTLPGTFTISTANTTSATTGPFVYTIVCINAQGCSSTAVASLSVVVNPEVTATPVVASTVVCALNGPAKFTPTGCPTSTTALFKGPGLPTSGSLVATLTVATSGFTSTTVLSYTVSCMNSSSCTGPTTPFSLTVLPTPANASLTVASAAASTTINVASAPTPFAGAFTVCQGSSLSVITNCPITTSSSSATAGSVITSPATGTAGSGLGGAITPINSSTGFATFTIDTSAPTTVPVQYTFTCQNTLGCTSIQSTTLTLTISASAGPAVLVTPTVQTACQGTQVIAIASCPVNTTAVFRRITAANGNGTVLGTPIVLASTTIAAGSLSFSALAQGTGAVSNTGTYGFDVTCAPSNTACTSAPIPYTTVIKAAPANATLVAQISSSPTASLSAIAFDGIPGAGASLTVCQGIPVNLTVTGCNPVGGTPAAPIVIIPVGGTSGSVSIGGSNTGTAGNAGFEFYTIPTATLSGPYLVTVNCTNTNGCSSLTVTSLTLTVNPTPATPAPIVARNGVPVSGFPNIVVCEGTAANPLAFTANCPTGTLLTTVSSGIGGSGIPVITAGLSTTPGTFSIATTIAGAASFSAASYTIVCTNSSNCTSSSVFNLSVVAAPSNAFTVTAGIASATGPIAIASAGTGNGSATICVGTPVDLTVVGCPTGTPSTTSTIGSGGNSGIIIGGGGVQPGTNVPGVFPNVLSGNEAPGVYSVTVVCVNSAGCRSTAVRGITFTITPVPSPVVATLNSFTSTCSGGVGNSAVGTLYCPTGQNVFFTLRGLRATGAPVTGTGNNFTALTATNSSTATIDLGTLPGGAAGPGMYTLVAACGSSSLCQGPTSRFVFNNREIPSEPTVVQANPNAICVGQSTTLTAQGCAGGTIIWYVATVPVGTTIGTGSTLVIAPTATANYYATCQLNAPCQSNPTTQITVTVNPPVNAVPSIAAQPNPTSPGGSVTLSGFGCPVGNTTIFYSDAAGTVEVGRSITGSFVVNPTQNTLYYAACSNGVCRGPITTGILVTVNACNFVATVTPASATLCPGGSTLLTASGGSSYVWSNGAGNVQQITVQAPGTYQVIVTNAAGCTASATAVVVAGTTPVPTISGNTNIIQGQTATLTASGGITYLWSTGAITPTISTQTGGVYSVTVTGAGGCTAVAQVTVTVQPLPAAPSVTPGTNLNVCLGGNVLLVAQCTTGQPRFNRGNVSFNQPTYLVESPVVGTQTINVVCVVNGVEGNVTPVTVTFNAAPTVGITGNTQICRDIATGAITSATLTATGATSYLWSNGATTPSIVVATPGVYSVTGTTAGCTGIAQVTTTSAVCGNVTPIAITGASINCNTREITITTSGGNGQPVERMIQLVTLWVPAGQPLLLDQAVIADANNTTVQLYVRQANGNMAGPFAFNFRTTCPASGSVTPPAPGTTATTPTGVTACGVAYTPNGQPFSLSVGFQCNPGITPHVINFIPSGGVNATSVIEFMSIGITPWTQSCSETFDLNNTDNNQFTINARQRDPNTGAILASTQITVTSPCVKKDGAGREATTEKGDLDVTVLGNPTLGDKVEVEVRGAEGQRLQLRMTNGQGASVSEVAVENAGTVERQTIGLGRSAGMYFLQVITPTKVKTVKVVRQ